MSGVFETTFLQDQTALPFAHTHCLHASSVFFPANWIPKKISQSHFQCNSQIVFWKFSPHESQQNHNYVGNPHQVILRHSLAPVNTLTLLSVLLSLLVLLALSLSLSPLLPIFSSELPTPLFSFYYPIYRLRWVEVLWLPFDLTHVGGVQSNSSW